MAKVPSKIWLPFLRDISAKLRANNYAILDQFVGSITQAADNLRNEKDVSFDDMTIEIWMPGLNKADGTSYIEKIKYTKFNIQTLYSAVYGLIKNFENHPELFNTFSAQLANDGSFKLSFDIIYPDGGETEHEVARIEIPKPAP